MEGDFRHCGGGLDNLTYCGLYGVGCSVQALKFPRSRFKYSDGDHAWGRHQMQLIQSVVERMSNGAIVTNYSEILDSLQGIFVTSSLLR